MSTMLSVKDKIKTQKWKMSIKCILATIIGVIVVVVLYFPTRHARHYEYIDVDDIFDELVFNHGNFVSPNHKNCNYIDVIVNNTENRVDDLLIYKDYEKPNLGGEYSPPCQALLESAIIIPYRNREEQLNVFLNYMHGFLQKQRLKYRIFVVEQNDTLPFNRAKMLNYGAKVAISLNYTCLILHDVDLIPLNSGNIYACSKKPRHMSSSLDSFRYNLPYLTLFGGAVSIQAHQFQAVNGMSNQYYGWGAEDDDFYKRLEARDLIPYRFSPKISKYTMLVHKKVPPSNNRYSNLKDALERQSSDGLNSISSHYEVHLEDLYTHIITN